MSSQSQRQVDADFALLVADETPAIVAYIDKKQTYRFANKAYLD